MKKLFLFLTLFAIAGASPRSGTAQGAETTARGVFAKIAPRARQWQADAVLTNLSTLEARADGTARTWSSLFYSLTAKKWLAVTASGGRVDVLEVDQGLTDAVGEFIDSDQALQVAKKNGLEPPKETMMGLAWMGAKDGAPCWTVGGGFEPGAVGIVLNAKTGEFITKHESQ
jgi:hypothetical protein